jgi:hypothetical protein
MTNGDKHHRLPFPNNDDDTERVGQSACPVFAGAPSWVTIFSYQYCTYSTHAHISAPMSAMMMECPSLVLEIETTGRFRVLFLARNLGMIRLATFTSFFLSPMTPPPPLLPPWSSAVHPLRPWPEKGGVVLRRWGVGTSSRRLPDRTCKVTVRCVFVRVLRMRLCV